MKTRRALMPFEELIRILLKKKQVKLIRQLLRIYNINDFLTCIQDHLSELPRFQEWIEKYEGTWWEVTWQPPLSPRSESAIQQCVYAADSLSDAVRLRPHLEVSFRIFTSQQINSAFEENNTWMDETEEDSNEIDENEELKIEQFL